MQRRPPKKSVKKLPGPSDRTPPPGLEESLNRFMKDPLDRTAWTDIYRSSYGPVFAYVSSLRIGDQDQGGWSVADTVQEAFVRFFEHFDAARCGRSARGCLTYLMVIARNVATDRIRRRRSRSRLGESVNEIADARAIHDVNQQDSLMDLREAMRGLPEMDRRITELLLLGESRMAIARQVKMTRRTLDVRIFRLRKKIRALLGRAAPS